MSQQQQYLNRAQALILALNTKDFTMVAGRGVGKGLVCACILRRNEEQMPGSNTAAVGPNSKRMWTNIIPSWDTHLRRWGFVEGVHYTWGRKPAKAWGWQEPIIKPMNWENTLSFRNGAYATIISQDRKGTSNSQSFDYIMIDEAKYINHEQFKEETLPANRGNGNIFGHLYFHHGIAKFSDMPTTKKGSWFLNDREKCDVEKVKLLEGLVASFMELRTKIANCIAAGQPVPAKDKFYLKKMSQTINMLRADTFLYKEFSSIENLEILGEDFIRQCKRDMPPATFRTTIMCKRVEHSEDSFYNAKSEKNLYTAVNKTYIDSLGFDMTKLRHVDCRMDSDVTEAEPLYISFDANANINWCVVGQPSLDMKLRILKSFYTKYERRLPELVDDFCEYYAPRRRKEVVFCYDATFVGNNFAVNKQDFHAVIKHCLIKHGWYVREIYIGSPWKHPVKNSLINRMFLGQARYQILINEENNRDLLVSIDSAMTVNGSNYKDKSGEKVPETEENKLESRTDGSDAFDTLCIAVETGSLATGYSGGAGFV